MDNVLNFWLGVIVVSTIGTLAHFVYDWSHQNKIVGMFTAVNESTWEHTKIALTPTFLWSLYDGFFYGQNPNYFLAKVSSLFVLIIVIPAIFYSYRAFTKKSFLIVDIGNFYISIVLSQLVFYVLIMTTSQPYAVNYLSCLVLFIIFGCYMTLTLEPLRTFLFKDPISGKYGFYAHRNLLKRRKRTASKKVAKKQ